LRREVAIHCRSQLVGEAECVVNQGKRLTNKFAPTGCAVVSEHGVLCRSQLVGETGYAVIQRKRLANKFAPTGGAVCRSMPVSAGANWLARRNAR